MLMTVRILAVLAAALVTHSMAATAEAKDKVKVGFIGPLTGGVSANGLGGRNSADLAVRLRNADAKAKYEYELVVLDDECKPNVAVQVANPGDLRGPSATTPADAQRRGVVLDKYRKGETTASARDEQAAGDVSKVVK